jgi:hypothetical protein
METSMTQENATQPGAFESASSARSQAMAEIAKRVHEQLTPDLNTFDEATGEIGARLEVQPAQQEQAQTPPPDQEDQEQQEQQQAQATQPVDDGLETIVIDGQEKRVKRDQIIEAGRRTLQKESAADRRLEEAAETLRRAKAYEQGVMQRQPSSDADTQQPPSSDAANGTGAESRTATPDIGTLVEQHLWIHDANKAAKRFRDEFKDIADDPYAARLVAQLEDERLRKAASEGTPLGDPWDAYQAHGQQIRTWLGKAKPAGTVEVSKDKAERKRDTVTVTGSTTRTPAPTTPKPLTVAEQIERMRVARQGKQIPNAR